LAPSVAGGERACEVAGQRRRRREQPREPADPRARVGVELGPGHETHRAALRVDHRGRRVAERRPVAAAQRVALRQRVAAGRGVERERVPDRVGGHQRSHGPPLREERREGRDPSADVAAVDGAHRRVAARGEREAQVPTGERVRQPDAPVAERVAHDAPLGRSAAHEQPSGRPGVREQVDAAAGVGERLAPTATGRPTSSARAASSSTTVRSVVFSRAASPAAVAGAYSTSTAPSPAPTG
jgi:hypothetical protein